MKKDSDSDDPDSDLRRPTTFPNNEKSRPSISKNTTLFHFSLKTELCTFGRLCRQKLGGEIQM